MPLQDASGIGVGQPRRERRRARVDEEAPRGSASGAGESGAHARRSATDPVSGDVPGDAGHEQHAAEQVDHQVAQARAVRRPGAARSR